MTSIIVESDSLKLINRSCLLSTKLDRLGSITKIDFMTSDELVLLFEVSFCHCRNCAKTHFYAKPFIYAQVGRVKEEIKIVYIQQ